MTSCVDFVLQNYFKRNNTETQGKNLVAFVLLVYENLKFGIIFDRTPPTYICTCITSFIINRRYTDDEIENPYFMRCAVSHKKH